MLYTKLTVMQVSGSTTTVPTSPGQVFQSDSPYDSYPPSDARRRDLEHDIAHPHFPRNNQWPTTSSESPHYPTAVTCGLLVDIYGFNTVTASQTATVKAPAPTSKVTSTGQPICMQHCSNCPAS